VLGDQCEYDSEMEQERLLDIPKVGCRARILLVLHQDGILRHYASTALGDGLDDRVRPSWSSSSLQIGAICEDVDKRPV